MIPNIPKEHTDESHESEMFEALKLLSDDYYVFHSLRINTVKNNTVYESETDFVIFNAKMGILCIEAKAGRVTCKEGIWYYSNGDVMSHGGPFEQADKNKWKLSKFFYDNGGTELRNKCKFMHCVWFPSIDQKALNNISLPVDCDKKLIMTKEALHDPTSFIEKIFSIELPNKQKTILSNSDTKKILSNFLCPSFDIFPSSTIDIDIKRIVFNRLLKEQSNILNFLNEQRTAIINGAAGTGKTVIAVQKAQREAAKGDKVLFLCYNRFLKEHLEKTYPHENISYYTIDGFGCKICGTSKCDYFEMKQKLEEMYFSGFPFTHIVIDEGQDFGIEDINENGIVDLLKDLIIDKTETGTVFIFYDKLQLIQLNSVIPDFISDADCKLTLYKNCRNTFSIATTSLAPITDRSPIICDEIRYSTEDDTVKMRFGSKDSCIKEINTILEDFKQKGYKDIVILSPKTESTTLISSQLKNGKFMGCLFSTCRKFKGLEADAILFIDIDKELFEDDSKLLFYVGTSRARFSLQLYSIMTDEECEYVVKECLGVEGRIKRPRRELCKALKTHMSGFAEHIF